MIITEYRITMTALDYKGDRYTLVFHKHTPEEVEATKAEYMVRCAGHDPRFEVEKVEYEADEEMWF